MAQARGFPHASPWAATRHAVLRHVHRDECEGRLGAWADRVVGRLPAAPEPPEMAVALEGKTLRGSKKPGAPGPHLVSALAHQVGVPRAQHAGDDTSHAITAVETLFQPWVLEGRMVTMDALLPQRHV